MKRIILVLLLAGLILPVQAVYYETLDYGKTIPECDGCMQYDSGDIYVTFVDDEGDVITYKRLTRSSYEMVRLWKSNNHPNNTKYADVWINSGRVHVCITDNSTGTHYIYYRGYGTGVADAQIVASSDECKIVEGPDGYPHIFADNDEYRWDGASWVTGSNVLSQHVKDVYVNGSSFYAVTDSTSAPAYNYAVFETRAANSGNFNINIAASTTAGARNAVIRMAGSDMWVGGGYCSAGDGYHLLSKFNGSNFINVTTLSSFMGGANCNLHLEDNALYYNTGDITVFRSSTQNSNIEYNATENQAYNLSEDTGTAVSAVLTKYFSAEADGNGTGFLLYNDDGSSLVLLRVDAPSYALSGHVYDAATMEAIVTLPVVDLEYNSTHSTDICDIEGYYTIGNLEAREYNYNVSEPGYISATGSLIIDGNTTRDFYLLKTTANVSYKSVALTFIDSFDNRVANENFKFTYMGPCSCLIGNEYYYSTDSNGVITDEFFEGDYRVQKDGYIIRDSLLDAYSNYVEFSVYDDPTVKTFYVLNLNQTSNVTIYVVDSATGDYIQNAAVRLISTQGYYLNYSGIGGDAKFVLPNNDYILKISHADYIDYPNEEHYFIDERVLDIAGNYTEYILLIPTTETLFSIYGNITDNHGVAINASVKIRGNGTYQIQGNVDFFNFTNLSGNQNYLVSANSSGYFDSGDYLVYLITNTRLDIMLDNISEIANLNLTIIEDFNVSGIRAELTDVTNMNSYNSVIKYTNGTGEAVFSGLIHYHRYKLILSKPGYKTNTTYLNFYDNSRTFHFNLTEMENRYTFSGYIYRSGTGFGIQGVTLELYQDGGNDTYQGVTNSEGRFEISDIEYGDYILNITKIGYFSNLFLPLNVYSDIEKNYYLESVEEVVGVRFFVTDNQSVGLADAAIRIVRDEEQEIISTDDNGNAYINLPKDKYSVELHKEGYESITDEIIVSKDGDTFDYQMEASLGDYQSFGESDLFGFWNTWGWLFLLVASILFMGAVIRTLGKAAAGQ